MTTLAGTLRRPRSQTPYEHRLSLVAGVLTEQTDLDAAAVQETAVQVLRLIDTIPEHIR